MPAATKEDLRRWFEEGVRDGGEFMIVFCDTYEWKDYPVYTKGGLEGFKKEYKRVMCSRIMEVYDLNIDIETQMREKRAFHYPQGFDLDDFLEEKYKELSQGRQP